MIHTLSISAIITNFSNLKMKALGLTFFILVLSKLGMTQIVLPRMFSNHMVLQRENEIPVWGTAPVGNTVTVELGGVHASATTNQEGKWITRLPAMKAGGPYQLAIYSGNNPDAVVRFSDVLIGDVWLASGQSNMEWSVQQSKDAKNEITHADFPNIRFLNVEHDKELTPQSNISGTWKICDTTNVRAFSAVAYHFARKIHQDHSIPIGIIQSAWGGTPVQSWTSREMLLTSPLSREATLANDTLTKNDFVIDSLNNIRYWEMIYNPQNNADKIVTSVSYNDTDWNEVEMPKLIKDLGIGAYEGVFWFRKTVSLPESFKGKDLLINLGHPEMVYSMYFNGAEICKNIWNGSPTHLYTIPAHLVKSGENKISVRIAMLWGGGGFNPPAEEMYITDNSTKVPLSGKWLYKQDAEPKLPKITNYHYYPTPLFNAMINPLIPYGLKGFIWYQGEANTFEAFNYRTLFPMLITDWRQRWGQGNLPFLYVQLANFMKMHTEPSESAWAELREAQTLTLSQPNTGMACTIDIGDANDIHPRNKQEVGRRLALLANKLVYGKPGLIASGPLYKSYKIKGSQVSITFMHTGSKLATKDGQEVKGFAIAGDDKKFHWAKAVVKGDAVVVYSSEVPKPIAVRYAWADNPECNLVNSEGLPAVPFRTDDWKLSTQR